jgi:RNA recognition motif-containing protein
MEEDLESAFKRYGKIIDIFVPKEPGNSRSRYALPSFTYLLTTNMMRMGLLSVFFLFF